MKENNIPVTIRRIDYSPPTFWIDSVSLTFELNDSSTLVTNTMSLRHNSSVSDTALKLDGVDLELVSVSLNDNALDETSYSIESEQLVLHDLPEQCRLVVATRIYPDRNTALEGLYLSSGNYCTQCEAEGFRKITYYLDRPDVLAKFDVRIEADKNRYPVLLSNGNFTEGGELADGRHYVQWSDPFPKPSYLFALVAGKLETLSDSFITCSGREIELVIYVEAHNLHKCQYAMESLKQSMRWDEEVFGLEYDLDIFMIVAVDDFNMGAMENKGLNVFNSKFVLAEQASATDTDFMGVQAVIAHEYFHNWTGNRVTCRDWFQLSLKEGLTVFRDQQFSSDMNSRAVKRIEDVRLLRARQFPEDAGPMAHPIRPDEYMEINNFYTVTVYEKGAEVIRMLHTLLGEKGFRQGMDLYFERFDGQAVTCEDFVQAMQDANDDAVDLRQFRLWYSQAGTPVVNVQSRYDAQAKEYHLQISQSCPPTPGQPDKLPLHIPFAIALIGPEGKAQKLYGSEKGINISDQGVSELTLDITAAETHIKFSNIETRPVASLLRNFSAPIILNTEYSDSELAFLMAYDTDEFDRWEAGQRLYKRVVEKLSGTDSISLDDSAFADFHQAFEQLLQAESQDPALLAAALTLPGVESVSESHEVMAIDPVFSAIQKLKKGLAARHTGRLLELAGNTAEAFSIDSAAIGRRSLRHSCLTLLGSLPAEVWKNHVCTLFESANNMTDKIAALRILCNVDIPEREQALQSFYAEWSNDRLVTDKWFTLQALSEREDTVAQVRRLTTHSAFELTNPNRIRSLIGAFAMSNTVRFHSSDGKGYELLAEYVLKLDQSNPQIAARLAGPLGRWQKLDAERQLLMRAQLSRIADSKELSPDVFEIVNKSLEGVQRSGT